MTSFPVSHKNSVKLLNLYTQVRLYDKKEGHMLMLAALYRPLCPGSARHSPSSCVFFICVLS